MQLFSFRCANMNEISHFSNFTSFGTKSLISLSYLSPSFIFNPSCLVLACSSFPFLIAFCSWYYMYVKLKLYLFPAAGCLT